MRILRRKIWSDRTSPVSSFISETNCSTAIFVPALSAHATFLHFQRLLSTGQQSLGSDRQRTRRQRSKLSNQVKPIVEGRKKALEKLWQSLFSDPSQWLDNRAEKVNPKYPDFKHRKTGDGLWVKDRWNPSWVDAELRAMAPGSLQADLFTWNARLARHVRQGEFEKTLELFRQMQREGMVPNNVSFIRALNACAGLRALEEGRRVHEQMIRTGYDSEGHVQNSLVDMYAKCGDLDYARKVFNEMPSRDVVAFNALIFGYGKGGHGQKALNLCSQMQSEGVCPDRVTYLGLLEACASLKALEQGREIHKSIEASGYEADTYVGSSLVNMYAKCESMEEARRVFDCMTVRDVVTWNSLILGFVKCGQGMKALELLNRMSSDGVVPDRVTHIGMLNACASVAAFEAGRRVHKQVIRRGYESDVYVCTSLIDMYSKCGSLEEAVRVFDTMPSRNAVAWNAMIAGYAMHGYALRALKLFEQMSQAGIKIDGVTCSSILSACDHAGLVDEGLQHFDSMTDFYNVHPQAEHYACLVDLLGRSGRLHEAEDRIKFMSCPPTESVWTALLGACRIHGNVDMGERVARELLEMDRDHAYAYVLLSQIHGEAGNMERSADIKREMLNRGVNKTPGCSWIEVNNELHSFTSGDLTHPQTAQIYKKLESLASEVERVERGTDKLLALNDFVEGGSDGPAKHHSERLAIAFGLLNTPANTTLRIVKNLRVCAVCHGTTKVLAKIVGRTIIVRDAHRFHHFQGGYCSCEDFW